MQRKREKVTGLRTGSLGVPGRTVQGRAAPRTTLGSAVYGAEP